MSTIRCHKWARQNTLICTNLPVHTHFMALFISVAALLQDIPVLVWVNIIHPSTVPAPSSARTCTVFVELILTYCRSHIYVSVSKVEALPTIPPLRREAIYDSTCKKKHWVDRTHSCKWSDHLLWPQGDGPHNVYGWSARQSMNLETTFKLKVVIYARSAFMLRTWLDKHNHTWRDCICLHCNCTQSNMQKWRIHKIN